MCRGWANPDMLFARQAAMFVHIGLSSRRCQASPAMPGFAGTQVSVHKSSFLYVSYQLAERMTRGARLSPVFHGPGPWICASTVPRLIHGSSPWMTKAARGNTADSLTVNLAFLSACIRVHPRLNFLAALALFHPSRRNIDIALPLIGPRNGAIIPGRRLTRIWGLSARITGKVAVGSVSSLSGLC